MAYIPTPVSCPEVEPMRRRYALAPLTLCLFVTVSPEVTEATPEPAAVTGSYVEARNCDVWTGPCFANADFNLTGKNAVLAWRIDAGELDGVSLDGLSVVAVVAAHNTLGLDQIGPAKAVLIVDQKATSEQR